MASGANKSVSAIYGHIMMTSGIAIHGHKREKKLTDTDISINGHITKPIYGHILMTSGIYRYIKLTMCCLLLYLLFIKKIKKHLNTLFLGSLIAKSPFRWRSVAKYLFTGPWHKKCLRNTQQKRNGRKASGATMYQCVYYWICLPLLIMQWTWICPIINMFNVWCRGHHGNSCTR